MVTSNKVCERRKKWHTSHHSSEGIEKQIKESEIEIANNKLVNTEEALKGIKDEDIKIPERTQIQFLKFAPLPMITQTPSVLKHPPFPEYLSELAGNH